MKTNCRYGHRTANRKGSDRRTGFSELPIQIPMAALPLPTPPRCLHHHVQIQVCRGHTNKAFPVNQFAYRLLCCHTELGKSNLLIMQVCVRKTHCKWLYCSKVEFESSTCLQNNFTSKQVLA